MSRMFHLIALALATAAVAAPIAQAATGPSGNTVPDPLAVSYLLGQGFSPGEIKVRVGQADPLALSYMRNHGFPRAQVEIQAAATKPIDPLAVSYLRGLGMTQAQIDDWTSGVCAQAVRPAVCSLPPSEPGAVATVTVEPDGFSWGDAGIGAGATLGAVLLLAGLGVSFAMSRHGRRRVAGA